MALRKSDIPLQKHTLNLFEGEFEALKELYGATGASAIIRELVHKHLIAVHKEAERLSLGTDPILEDI